MNWLIKQNYKHSQMDVSFPQKIERTAASISVNDSLNHVYKAIELIVPGNWKIIEQLINPHSMIKFQWYAVGTFQGYGVVDPQDEFLVKVFAYIRRSSNVIMPSEYGDDFELSKEWMNYSSNKLLSFLLP